MSEDIMEKPCSQDPSPLPETVVPAMAYVPFQQYGETFDDLKAFDCGTLFPVLNKPFYGRRGDSK